MFGYWRIVYRFLLLYAFSVRFVNQRAFSRLTIIDYLGNIRVKAAHSPRDPAIDLMRSPAVKQTAAADKHR